jgi:arsenate reductase
MITVYQYPACSTCKKALKWLDTKGIDYKSVHIVDSPPSQKVLGTILNETGLPLNKLFNTSGQLYREGGYKEKLKTMTEKEALAELSSHGKLIKRPLVVGEGVHLVGFSESAYKAALGG